MFDTIYNFLSENAVAVTIVIFLFVIFSRPIFFSNDAGDDQDWHDTIN